MMKEAGLSKSSSALFSGDNPVHIAPTSCLHRVDSGLTSKGLWNPGDIREPEMEKNVKISTDANFRPKR